MKNTHYESTLREIILTLLKNNYYLPEINVENNFLKETNTIGFLWKRKIKYIFTFSVSRSNNDFRICSILGHA